MRLEDLSPALRAQAEAKLGRPARPVRRKPAVPSEGEAALLFAMRAAKLPEPEREFLFSRPRRWRFDFAWPAHKLAVEVEGGTWNAGRHVRPEAFENDCGKYNAAVEAGWRVLRFTTAMVEDGRALLTIEAVLAQGASATKTQ